MTMYLARLRQLSLTVIDVEASISFYRDVLNLPMVARFGQLAFFDLDGVRLMVTRSEDGSCENSVLYFAVDDLRLAREALEARGVGFVDEPHLIFDDPSGTFGEPGHAEWMTFFKDPEGNLLALSARQPSG